MSSAPAEVIVQIKENFRIQKQAWGGQNSVIIPVSDYHISLALYARSSPFLERGNEAEDKAIINP